MEKKNVEKVIKLKVIVLMTFFIRGDTYGLC